MKVGENLYMYCASCPHHPLFHIWETGFEVSLTAVVNNNREMLSNLMVETEEASEMLIFQH
jgi:hypothetical protein